MKRITSFTKSIISITLMAMSSVALVSCYEDDPYYDDWYSSYDWYDNAYDYNNWDGNNTNDLASEASVLCHPWQGTLVYNYYENGQRKQAQMSVDMLFDRYDTNAVNGRGQETDYDNQGNSQVLKFAWYIDPKTENIYIKYDESGSIFYFDANRTDQYGFILNSNEFSGYAAGQNVDESLDFDLSRASLAKANLSETTSKKAKSSIPFKLMKR
jgi:hypothetical protein